MPLEKASMNTTYPKTKGLALSAMFAVLLGVLSLASIPLPFDPVPVPLQVFGIFLIVSLLGPYYGTLSCLIYLMFGLIGLPVFHGGSSGLPLLLGPTGGFLISFPVASLIGGSISRATAKTRRTDLALLGVSYGISLLIIYSLGTIWLMEYLHVTLGEAIILGTLPFVGFDLIKGVIAAPISARLRATRLDLPVNRTLRIGKIAEPEIQSG